MLTTCIVISTLLGALFTVFCFYKKDRLARQHATRLTDELEKMRSFQQTLQNELDQKSKSLTMYSLYVIEKQDALDELRREMEVLRKTSTQPVSHRIARLINSINNTNRIDKEWETFSKYFEEVHMGFFDKLKRKHPELNIYDLKLCALLKMNLHTKQIAALLDITPDSAKIARHRLRKKLKLESNANLINFLNELNMSNEIHVVN